MGKVEFKAADLTKTEWATVDLQVMSARRKSQLVFKSRPTK